MSIEKHKLGIEVVGSSISALLYLKVSEPNNAGPDVAAIKKRNRKIKIKVGTTANNAKWKSSRRMFENEGPYPVYHPVA